MQSTWHIYLLEPLQLGTQLLLPIFMFICITAFELHPSDILGENLKELVNRAAQLFPSKSTPKKSLSTY